MTVLEEPVNAVAEDTLARVYDAVGLVGRRR